LNLEGQMPRNVFMRLSEKKITSLMTCIFLFIVFKSLQNRAL
jgi:hypothetical protein